MIAYYYHSKNQVILNGQTYHLNGYALQLLSPSKASQHLKGLIEKTLVEGEQVTVTIQ
ncbi:hypothetical protein [Aliivibrio fischeri]|uniref:hypothetical protein n=1 Tax=Aliivibrio fischeri TaxID=668 RepID=UPI0012D861A8|nr:hypothetical protein [Aliivibrio fischeri]MUJ20331.1 hypothetical protein [Aliivibrio fischeri]